MSDRGQRDQMTDPDMAFVVHVDRGQLPTFQKLMHTRPGYPKQPRCERDRDSNDRVPLWGPTELPNQGDPLPTFSAFAISLLAEIPARPHLFCTTMPRGILYNFV